MIDWVNRFSRNLNFSIEHFVLVVGEKMLCSLLMSSLKLDLIGFVWYEKEKWRRNRRHDQIRNKFEIIINILREKTENAAWKKKGKHKLSGLITKCDQLTIGAVLEENKLKLVVYLKCKNEQQPQMMSRGGEDAPN